MLANSSDSLTADLKSIKVAAPEIRWPGRVLLLTLNFVPLLLVLFSIGTLCPRGQNAPYQAVDEAT